MILSGAEVGKVQDEYRIFGYLKKIRVLQTWLGYAKKIKCKLEGPFTS